MSTIAANYASHIDAPNIQSANAVTRATTILRLTYGLVPIVAGADKFMNLLTKWEQYLSPTLLKMLPFSTQTFMMITGVIEMLAGLLVLFRPKLGSMIVCAWLACLALNLLTTGHYLDVAVRDLVMAAGAFCLYTLCRRL